MESRNQNGHNEQGTTESFRAIQSKLDVLLRNSIAQDKLVVEKPSGTRVRTWDVGKYLGNDEQDACSIRNKEYRPKEHRLK